MNYLIDILASFSVMLNTLTGGSYRNTFSARVGYESSRGVKWAKRMEGFINMAPFFSSNHCKLEAINEGLITTKDQ